MFPLIPLPGGLFLPTYFTFITIGYCIGVFWLYKRAEDNHQSQRTAMDLAVIIMIGGFLGSRLFHVLFELPNYYVERPWDVFKVWQGGFVFYGGAIGAILPAYFLVRHREEPVYLWLNIFAPIVPLLYGIGRFATLLSGSGYGKPTDLPWGIVYPAGTEAPAGISLHPTPIYAMLWELGVLIVVLILLNKSSLFGRKIYSGFAFGSMVILHGIGRAIMEQFRNDFRGELIAGLTISTWLSFAIVAVGVVICRNRIHPYAKD
ncbi:MAG: prolipoprotein diacylglyceryl transferase [Pseudomonadota bacterium]